MVVSRGLPVVARPGVLVVLVPGRRGDVREEHRPLGHNADDEGPARACLRPRAAGRVDDGGVQITEEMKRRYETADVATLVGLLPVLWREQQRMDDTIRKFGEANRESEANTDRVKAQMRDQLLHLVPLAEAHPSPETDAAIAELRRLVLDHSHEENEVRARELTTRWLLYLVRLRELEQLAVGRLVADGWLPEE